MAEDHRERVPGCGTPVVIFQNFDTLNNSANTNNWVWNYRFTCQRRDRSIAWVQFTAAGNTASATLGPVYFPPDGDSASADFSETAGTNAQVAVVCTVGTFYGATSQVATCNFTVAVATNTQAEAVFYSGQLQLRASNCNDRPL